MIDTTKTTTELTNEEKCGQEIQVILDKYNCYLDATILLAKGVVRPQILITEKPSELLKP